MEDLFKLISNYGFPIVVAGYLLFRQEKKMDKLNDLITKKDGIFDRIEDIANTIKDCCKRK